MQQENVAGDEARGEPSFRNRSGGQEPVVFTIGHSTRSFSEVLEMLRENAVDLLVDVRSFPSSRKFPQWNKSAIEKELPKDISYRWIKKLGGRRHTPANVISVNQGWRVKAFRDYADYMSTSEFKQGLQELLDLTVTNTAATMCSEAVPWRCHRRLITDALIMKGVNVEDILSLHSVRTATMTPFARVRNGEIIYPTCPADSPG